METITMTLKEWRFTLEDNIRYEIEDDRNPFREARLVQYFNYVLSEILKLNAKDDNYITVEKIDDDTIKCYIIK